MTLSGLSTGGEAWFEIERNGGLDGVVGRRRSSRCRRAIASGAIRAEALLDTADHHVADHLAGDAGGGGHPADDLAVVAIEGEGDAHDLAVPAGHRRKPRSVLRPSGLGRVSSRNRIHPRSLGKPPLGPISDIPLVIVIKLSKHGHRLRASCKRAHMKYRRFHPLSTGG